MSSPAYSRAARSLPHAYPFVLIDRVVEFRKGKDIVCIKNVSSGEDCFQGQPPGVQVFPPVYIIEAMAQTSGLLISEGSGGAYLSLIKDAVFHRPVYPGDQLIITSRLSHSFIPLFQFEAKAVVGDRTVSEAELTLSLI